MTSAPSLFASVPMRKRWFGFVDNRYLALVCRLLLAAVFLLSASGKLVDIEAYSVDVVYDFGILPMWAARPFGLVMPFIELLCGLGMLGGVLTRLSAFGLSLMNLAFFIAKGSLLLQGRDIDCGCFGAIVGTLASFTIWLDIPQMLMAMVVLFSLNRHWVAIGGLLPQAWKDKLHLVW